MLSCVFAVVAPTMVDVFRMHGDRHLARYRGLRCMVLRVVGLSLWKNVTLGQHLSIRGGGTA